jgi:hypothetical protein
MVGELYKCRIDMTFSDIKPSLFQNSPTLVSQLVAKPWPPTYIIFLQNSYFTHVVTDEPLTDRKFPILRALVYVPFVTEGHWRGSNSQPLGYEAPSLPVSLKDEDTMLDSS